MDETKQMIEKIFWDIDETLIHTSIRPFEKGTKYEHFVLPDDSTDYYTIIRSCSHKLIEYSRNLVGKDNVFILTSSTHDYANEVNRLAGWGFETDRIITREDIDNHRYATAYGSSTTVPHKLANTNNVLIDNLPPRYNEAKMILIGIKVDNYLQIRDYYGVNFSDETFEEDVMEFLTDKMSETTED